MMQNSVYWRFTRIKKCSSALFSYALVVLRRSRWLTVDRQRGKRYKRGTTMYLLRAPGFMETWRGTEDPTQLVLLALEINFQVHDEWSLDKDLASLPLSFLLLVVLFTFLVDRRRRSFSCLVASLYYLPYPSPSLPVVIPALDPCTQVPKAVRPLFQLVLLQSKQGRDSSSNTAHGYLVWLWCRLQPNYLWPEFRITCYTAVAMH